MRDPFPRRSNASCRARSASGESELDAATQSPAGDKWIILPFEKVIQSNDTQILFRSAATKYVTTNRTCWNESCKTEVSTGDLINDENLRAQVERFNKGEEVDETVLSDLIVKAGQEKCEEPPVKKFKQNNVSQNQNKTNQQQSKPKTKRVTLGMMKERNAEFDKYLLPEEKSCQVIITVFREL